MSFSEDVLDLDGVARSRGRHAMPLRAYILCLSLYIAGGLALAAFVASYTYEMQPNWMWIVGYFVVVLPGIYLSAAHDWEMSTLGYLLVVLGTGAIIGPYVNQYQTESVIQIGMITMAVTLGVGTAGALWPKSVEHWGGFLLTALLVLIFADLSRILMAVFGFEPQSLRAFDWLACLLFTGYIFYDMNRAVRMDYTLDNAVDMAVSLYLDIINLFIRALASGGKRKSD